MNRIHNNPRYFGTRKTLRNNATPHEKILWEHLKGRKLENRKFRRQHSVGHYILDFYCPEEMLCIELDGKHHLSKANRLRDQLRDDTLHDLRIKVLRFQNDEIIFSIEKVLDFIKRHFNQKPNNLLKEKKNP